MQVAKFSMLFIARIDPTSEEQPVLQNVSESDLSRRDLQMVEEFRRLRHQISSLHNRYRGNERY